MRYMFGPCELRPASRELLVAGAARAVEPQVFDLLRLLIDERARLVSRDELVAAVWGGRVVSDSAISARISAARAAIGDDGTQQRWIRTVARRGFRFVGEVEVAPSAADAAPPEAGAARAGACQAVRFCRSCDGTRIGYGVTGTGPALVKVGHWLTHLEHDWRSPIWRPALDELSRHFQVTRYDQRGNGLSEWQIDDFAQSRFVEDLEAVVDAAGLDRFVLYGTSQGAPIAVDYAARHPQRVTRLILHGGYRTGRLRRASQSEREQGEAILTLIRHGWGRRGSAFIQAFAAMFMPGGTRVQIDSLADLQELTTSPENAAAIRAAVDNFDVADLLPKVAVPTLVLHARDDGIQPLEQGRELAAGIAGAEFVLLDSANHVLLPQEPAWADFFRELLRFAGGR